MGDGRVEKLDARVSSREGGPGRQGGAVRIAVAGEADPGGGAGAADALLTAAKALIEAQFRNADLSPADMARRLGCSRAVLYRSFANAGLTVAGYLREVRFRHFLEALRSGADTPISRLAYESGFTASPTDFTKLFKRAYGITPSEARARLSP